MNTPRAYTPEEVRDQLLGHIRFMVEYWLNETGTSDVREKIEGLAFSILTTLDGCTSLPAFLVTPTPHPSDKKYHIEKSENWYPEDRPDLGMLHDHFYRREG